jgi:hypothetical protein
VHLETCRHTSKPSTLVDLSKFDMVVVWDGVFGESDGDLICHLDHSDARHGP